MRTNVNLAIHVKVKSGRQDLLAHRMEWCATAKGARAGPDAVLMSNSSDHPLDLHTYVKVKSSFACGNTRPPGVRSQVSRCVLVRRLGRRHPRGRTGQQLTRPRRHDERGRPGYRRRRPARCLRRPTPWLARNLLGPCSLRRSRSTGNHAVHSRRCRPQHTIHPRRASRDDEPPHSHPRHRHHSRHRRLHDSLQLPVPAGYQPCGDTVLGRPLVFVVFGLGAIIGTNLAGRFADKRPITTFITATAGTVALMALLVPLSTNAVATFVLMFLLGIAGMGIPPVGTGLAVRFAPAAPTLAAISVSANRDRHLARRISARIDAGRSRPADCRDHHGSPRPPGASGHGRDANDQRNGLTRQTKLAR